MKRIAIPLVIFGLTSLLSLRSAYAAERDWGNTGSDFNTTTSWIGGVVPTTGDVAWFKSAAVTNPNLSTSVSIAGFYFGDKAGGTASSGYTITSSSSAIAFTLTGTASSTSGTETSNSGAAAIGADNTSGSNTINAPLILGGANNTTQTFFQAAGGTLIVNGAISNTNNITLSLGSAAGNFQLNGANTYTGGTTFGNAGTLSLGNNSALGTGNLTVSSTGTVSAGGGARAISNNVVWSGNGTIGGANDLTINGTFTSSGAASRTLTVNNTGTTTLGNVFLAASDVAGGLTIAGSGSTVINGVITNNGAANTVASSLTLNAPTGGTLTLNGANTYTGATTLSSGNLVVGNKAAFGSGTVAINNITTVSASTNLSGANAVANTATLGGNSTFTGTNNIEFSGTVTATGSRTITNNIAGASLTFSGPINLSSSATARTVTFGGSGNTVISGSIANGNGSVSSLVYSGSASLTLSGAANSYSGGTIINNGTVVAKADGALGGGNVSLTAGGVTLTLQNGATQNYISDNASISMVTGSILNLNFTGTDTVGNYIIDGVLQPAGIYNASNEPTLITGSGMINNLALVPEPATYMLIGLGTLVCAQQFRRKKKS